MEVNNPLNRALPLPVDVVSAVLLASIGLIGEGDAKRPLNRAFPPRDEVTPGEAYNG